MFDLAQLHRISCVTLVVMMMAVLSPTLTKLMGSDRIGSYVMEVCTVDGTKQLLVSEIDFDQSGLASVEDSDPADTYGHGVDCPYCHTQWAKFLVSATKIYIFLPSLVLLPTLFYQAPNTLFAWTTRSARAPPTVS